LASKDIKEIFAENFKQYREKSDKTTSELAEALGVAQSTISDWENAKKMPRAGALEKISEYFKINKSDLLLDKNENIAEGKSEIAMLPIVAKISCGNGVVAYENIEGYVATPREWLNGGEYIYVRAKGDSMINARIMDGDLLLIRRQEEVENGEIAAVLVDDEALLKRVYKTENALILQSENPHYPPIVLDENYNVRIIGKLKRNVIEY